jgi:dinuclear metal center YbgI/SA1388 family protein
VIVRYCDRLLRTAQVQDYDQAANGLQVQNRGAVTRIAAAVDATLATVRLAAAAKADLLLVHHGLFWSPTHPWTGKRHEMLCCLIENGLAVYSSHLPLDAHSRLGNNAQLCAALGLKKLRPFLLHDGQCIGFQAKANISRADLARRLQRATGARPRVIPAGPQTCRRIGVVSGGAGEDLKRAAEEGVDTFITGEGPHWTYGWLRLGLGPSTAGITQRDVRRQGAGSPPIHPVQCPDIPDHPRACSSGVWDGW